MVGPFLGQHDPDIFGDGTLLVFDNKAWVKQSTPVRWLEQPQAWGFSRILRLDPATQQVLWSFEGTTAFPFYTSIQGKQQILETATSWSRIRRAGGRLRSPPRTATGLYGST